MAKGKLFEFAVIYHPKQKVKKEGEDEPPSKKSVLVKAPESVLATSEQEVGILAARSVPEEYIDKLEDVEIVIRPF